MIEGCNICAGGTVVWPPGDGEDPPGPCCGPPH